MSLIKLKPRPIKRDIERLRDDRLFLIACDDTYAPKQYFNFFSLPRVHVHVIETTDGTSSAPHVLARLLETEHEEDDELWMLLDTDHCINREHLPSFVKALREAKRNGVEVALSRSCFEIWLLLHHVDEAEIQSLKNAKAVEAKLKKVLGSYDKTKLRLEDFPISAVADAYMRAKRLDKTVSGGSIPEANTTRVHLLLKSILKKVLKSQAAPGFHVLLDAINTQRPTSPTPIKKDARKPK